MMKFNAIEFTYSATADLTEEFRDFDEMLKKNDAGADNADEIKKTYNHLSSLIQGFEYMAEFIADDDDRRELTKVLSDLRDYHGSFYSRAASAIYTKTMGKPVTVTRGTCDGVDTITVKVEDHLPRTFHKVDEVKTFIIALAEGEA